MVVMKHNNHNQTDIKESYCNCFIKKGRIWKTESLIRKAETLPIFQFDVTDINLDEILRWQLVNLRDYLNHYRRVNQADLLKPIILRSDDYIMNGWHRVIKALFDGKKYILAKQFKVDPEPDFKI